MKSNYFDVRAWLVNILLLALLAVVPARAAETLTFIHTDAAGSPVAATDQNGAVLWCEAYRPYGERTRNEAASTGNRQFFHGKAADPDTGLSYFGARYYDPIVGRFLGVDPQHFDQDNLHSFNRYAYGNNNPYKFTDPDGHAVVPIVLGIIALATTGYEMHPMSMPQVPFNSGAAVSTVGPGDVLGAAAVGAGLTRSAVNIGREAGSIRNVNSVGGTMNCVNCAIATDAALAGRPASALPGGPTRIGVLEKQFGGHFGRATSGIDPIISIMSEAGNGARGIVFGSSGSEVGHVFNVVNQRGTIRFLDGQTGKAANTDDFKSFQLLRTN